MTPPPRSTVLVVEDDPDMRLLIGETIRLHGFEVEVAATGDEAIRRLAHEGVDLVLLDRHLPGGLDGLEVLRWIRRRRETARLPVIMLTADARQGASSTGLDLGADDYVTKPFDQEDLVARIRSRLRSVDVWRAAVDQEIDRRNALLSAASTTAGEDDLSIAGADLCDELLRLPEVAGVEVWELRGETLHAVAGAGQGALDFLADAVDRHRVLARRAGSGPFTVNGRSHETDDVVPVAVAPIRFDAQMIGLLAVTAPVDAPSSVTDRLVSIAADFASLAGAVLGKGLIESVRRQHEAERIRALLESGAFWPVFQPVLVLGTSLIAGYEALTRFEDADTEATFLSAALVGMRRDLELRTMEAAVDAARALPLDRWVAINVSPTLLADPGELWACLGELGDRQIVLEVAEHEPVHSYDALHSALASSPHNVLLAVDDAGSRYAGLAHILALRADFVKIDQQWIHGIETDPDKRALVAGMQHFARESGTTLIAEGIETEAQLDTVTGLEIALGQGQYLAPPSAVSVGT